MSTETPTAAVAPGTTSSAGANTRWFALAVLAIAQLMVVLDATIVNVALPTIQTALGFKNESDLQWVVNAYTLAFGGFLLFGGRLADRIGRRLVFLCGAGLFVVASGVAGFADGPGLLIVARAVQGLGGALMAPAALSLLTTLFTEGSERNKALGIWAAISAGGSAIGLLLGGILTSGISWRWVFFVNLPIGIAAVVFAPRFVPESKDEHAGGFDIPGAVLVTGGLSALVYVLVRANEVGWASAQTIVLFVVAFAALAGFVRLQARGKSPLMPLRLFKIGSVGGADLASLLIGAALFSMFFFVTLYLQQIHHYSAIKTGLAFLPVSAFIIFSAGAGSQLLNRFGPRPVLVTGMASAAVGLLLLTRISPTGGYVGDVLIPMALIGIGLGAAFVSLTAAAVAGVPEDDSGIASALVNAGQQVGGALGLAILTAVSNARFNAVAPANHDPALLASATTSSWAWAFAVGAGLLIVGAIAAFFMIKVTAKDVAEAPAAAV